MATLNSCKKELGSIISELESIEWGIHHDFEGIGQERCANCVDRVSRHYQRVKSRLDRINMNRLAEWALGEGSGGGGR